jgi:Cytochrome P460
MKRWTALALCAASVATVWAATGGAMKSVEFPTGYRNWQHVKSMIIEPGHPLAGLVEGTHHIYANPKAMAGYSKRPFADGSVIVFDLFETQRGDMAIAEGARKAVIVMRKDRKRYAATNGWGYEVFAGGDSAKPQIGAKAAEMCHSCHTAQSARDYVFSDYRP